MKSVKFSALMAVAVIAASCAKEGTHSVDESNKVALEPMCIEASDESQTKTVLDGKSVNWTDGDKIAVYSNINYNKGYIFPATDIKGNSATFNGEVPVGTESFFAVYPPERVVSVNKDGVTVNIPADQTPAAGTFAEEHNITVAQGKKTPGVPSVGTITFNNVCSYVKFTVPAYVSDVNTVTISSDDAIAGDLTVDYTGENPKYTIAADGAKTTISMSGSFGAGETFIFVIAPGFVSNFRIDITAANGNWTRTVSQGFTATAGRPVNLGTVDFKIASMTAKVNHTYDGKTLTGTNLVIDNLNIPDHLTGYVQKVHIEIIPEGKTDAVRSADITDFSTQTSIAVNSTTYPYLPKGKYTIKSTYTMSGGTTSRETTGSFSVPAPTFSVNTPSAHTSYDTYYNNGKYKNADAANAEDGSTIFGVKDNGVCISKDILDNPKYESLIGKYSFTIDDKNAEAGDHANQTWGAHKVVAKFTFDGVEKTSEALTCHVTGLPYKPTTPTNTGDHAWSITSGGGKISFSSKYVTLGSSGTVTSDPTIKSPLFYIPAGETINVTAKSNVDLFSNKAWITYDCTLTIALNGAKTSQKSSETKGTNHSIDLEGIFSSDQNYITYSTNGHTELAGKCNINTVELIYRQLN